MAVEKTIIVDDVGAGTRIDAYIASLLPDVSRARIQSLLSDGFIRTQTGKVKASYRVNCGDVLTIVLPDAKPTALVAEDIELEILYEDSDLVVLNKSAGLVVHPGAGHAAGTLVNALLHRYPDMHVGDVQRPGLVHRLDKETSGVMVCARHDQAFMALAAQFKSRDVKKLYRAFCFGKLKSTRFELVTGHARHKNDRKRFTTKIAPPSKTGEGVRLAHSRFETLLFAGGVSEVKVELLTGRTHQIRAHLADIHHPLLQDSLYGSEGRLKQLPDTPVRQAVLALTRHALHAESIDFSHPSTGKSMHFVARLPEDLQTIHDVMTMVSAES